MCVLPKGFLVISWSPRRRVVDLHFDTICRVFLMTVAAAATPDRRPTGRRRPSRRIETSPSPPTSCRFSFYFARLFIYNCCFFCVYYYCLRLRRKVRECMCCIFWYVVQNMLLNSKLFQIEIRFAYIYLFLLSFDGCFLICFFLFTQIESR